MPTPKGKSILSCLILIRCLPADFPSLAPEVQSRLENLASRLRDWVDRQLDDLAVLAVTEMIALLDTWRGYLVYHRSSSAASLAIQPLNKLIPAVIKLVNSSSSLEALAVWASFNSLLAEDIKTPGADPLESIGTLIAVFLATGKVLLAKSASGEGGSIRSTQDTSLTIRFAADDVIPSLPLARSVRSWPPDQYKHACTLLKEHLQTQRSSDPLELVMVLRLGETILCNAPEGTCGLSYA